MNRRSFLKGIGAAAVMPALSGMTPQQLILLGGRVRPSWVHPLAIYADDYKLGQYWRSQGGLIPQTDQLPTTRSSGIILPNAAGVYQSLGNNTLPRTDRGLYANGQIPALNANGSNPQSATGWTNAGTPVIENAPDEGIFRPVYFSSPDSNSHRRINGLGSLAAGVTYGVKIRYDNNAPNPASQVRVTVQNTTSGQFTILLGGFGSIAKSGTDTFGTITIVRQDASGADLLISPASNGTCNIGIGTGIEDDSQVRILGVDATNTPFVPDAWVSTASPAPTLLTSDIRTVQGVRPSNGQAEPFPGWEAAGLDNGFTILIELETRVRNAATRRPLIFAGGTGAFRLETGTAGTGFRVYSSDGTLDGTTNFQGGLSGGPSRAAVRVQGSETATARQGYDSVSKAVRGFVQQPQSLFIGNQSNLAAPWNDWVYELQVCKPLTNEQLLAWVNA